MTAQSDEMIEKNRIEKAKNDLIGTIYYSGITTLMQLDSTDTPEEKETWGALEKFISKSGIDKDKADRIMELVNDYGCTTEEHGFKKGFHFAMRLCMEGMRGGNIL